MKKVFMLLLPILVLVMAISVVGCQATGTTTTTTTTTVKPPVTLNISAASSLTKALNEINALYVQLNPNVTITPSYGASGTLQTQITNGAPADIFFSADEAKMDTLQNQDLLINDTRKDLLNNSIVLIVPLDSTLNLTSFNDLTNANVKLVAVGDPKSVPAGTYATQAFDELGITAQVQPKEVLGANVTQVLTYVESDNVDAGILYLTDALASTKVKVVATGPAEVNAKITYPIAVIKATKVPDTAKDYVNFLSTAQAKAIFLKYGFNLISK
jgi:molybdate transport system substrate-binding protein